MCVIVYESSARSGLSVKVTVPVAALVYAGGTTCRPESAAVSTRAEPASTMGTSTGATGTSTPASATPLSVTGTGSSPQPVRPRPAVDEASTTAMIR